MPSAPSAVVIPHYSYSTGKFVGLTTRFNLLVSQNWLKISMCMITDGAHAYVIESVI